jgi:hypothetical protein
MTIYDYRPQQSPLRHKSYLSNFMLLNMLGVLWLDGKSIDWPVLTKFEAKAADESR